MRREAHLSQAFPFALLVLVVILLAAMPWHRPHPNHQFMLELLRSHLADEPPAVQDSAAGDRSWRSLNLVRVVSSVPMMTSKSSLVMLDSRSPQGASTKRGAHEQDEFRTT